MRITRAYTITHPIKKILDSKHNKSEYVCRAVAKLHAQESEFSLRDVSTRRLLATILSRMNDDDPLRRLIEERYKES